MFKISMLMMLEIHSRFPARRGPDGVAEAAVVGAEPLADAAVVDGDGLAPHAAPISALTTSNEPSRSAVGRLPMSLLLAVPLSKPVRIRTAA
jgi:hypothetical protein